MAANMQMQASNSPADIEVAQIHLMEGHLGVLALACWSITGETSNAVILYPLLASGTA